MGQTNTTEVITACAYISSRALPDMVNSMLCQAHLGQSDWIPVIVARDDGTGGYTFQPRPDPDSVVVRFELPAGMSCMTVGTPGRLTSLGEFANHKSGNAQKTQLVLVPCLPAIFAQEALFGDEAALKSTQSNLKRFLPDRGTWLALKTGTPVADQSVEFDFPNIPSGGLAKSVESLEKVAAAVAMAVRFGFTDLGKSRTVSYDVGTAALLRQLLELTAQSPNIKTSVTDCKSILGHLFKSSKSNGIAPGVSPRSWKEDGAGAGQLAALLSEFALSTPVKDGDMFDRPPPGTEAEKSPDQWVLRHVLRSVIEKNGIPGIQDVVKILDEARDGVGERCKNSAALVNRTQEGLRVIAKNVELAEDRIERYREQFGDLDGLNGLAHVFWGWSDDPLKNFQHRLIPLKTASPRALQIASFVYAAACGTGRLPARYLGDPVWHAAYRRAWELLLSVPDRLHERTPAKELWKAERSETKPTPNGQTVGITLPFGIPVYLHLSDPLLAVHGLVASALVSPASKVPMADTVLASLEKPFSTLPPDLRKLCVFDLQVEWRGGSILKFDGKHLVFENLEEKSTKWIYRWSDSSEAADRLSDSKTLTAVLNSLSMASLESLRQVVAAEVQITE